MESNTFSLLTSCAQTTVEDYVIGVMESILKPKKIPTAVCYFFNFLDAEALKNKISDSDILHIWKTNRCAVSNYF